MTDGTVFALPSSVLLAGPVPGASVVGYAQVCQHQLALTPSGLYRLETQPNVSLATWSAVPLPSGFAGGDLSGGSLHTVRGDLYVFSRLGEALRLTLEPCAP